MKCKDCKEYACIKRSENANCFFEEMGDYAENEKEKLYWGHFRAEAAKDILCAMIRRHDYCIEEVVDGIDKAICVADNLISKLKEKEEK